MRERARQSAPVFERACRLAIACAALVGASRARASDVRVTWDVPPAVCPDVEHIRRSLSRRLQREVTFGSPAPMTLDAHIHPEDEGYVLRLRTESGQGVELRELRARTCNELVRASVLIAALSFPRTGETLSVKDVHAEAPRRPEPYASAQLLLDLGTLPALGVGPRLAFGVALGRTSLELNALMLLPQDASVASRPQPVARLQLMAAGAAGCYMLVRRPELSACLQLEAGVLHARSQNVASPRDTDTFWLLPSTGARLGVWITRWLRGTAELSAGLPWNRVTFAIDDIGPVEHVARVVGRLQAGLEVRL